MSVSLQAESTTPAALVVGPTARLVAASQGHVWSGIVEAGEIAEEVAARRQKDRAGDLIRQRGIWPRIERIARLAKLSGAWEIHTLAVEALGLAARYDELDDGEDGHDDAIDGQAGTLHGALVQSNRLHGVLLGQREAGDQPARCGREDRHEGPCVFVAVEDAGAAP